MRAGRPERALVVRAVDVDVAGEGIAAGALVHARLGAGEGQDAGEDEIARIGRRPARSRRWAPGSRTRCRRARHRRSGGRSCARRAACGSCRRRRRPRRRRWSRDSRRGSRRLRREAAAAGGRRPRGGARHRGRGPLAHESGRSGSRRGHRHLAWRSFARRLIAWRSGASRPPPGCWSRRSCGGSGGG